MARTREAGILRKKKNINFRLDEDLYEHIVKKVGERMVDTGKLYTVGDWVRDAIRPRILSEIKEVTNGSEE